MKNLFFKTIFLLFAVVFISCNKDSEELLGNSDNIESRSSRVLPTTKAGMLVFGTKSELSDHFDYISTLNDDEELALETSLGYTSLRSIYETMSESEMEARSIKINAPFLAAVLNEYHEFAVEGVVYKYISDYIVTNGPISEIGKIISMRNTNKIWDHGLKIHDDKLKREIFDDVANGPVDPEGPTGDPVDPVLDDGDDNDDEIEPRSSCTFEIEVVDISADERIYYRIIGKDQDGEKVENCQVKLTIDWGDGNVSNITGAIGEIASYTYDLSLNEMQNFEISMTITTIFCNQCSDGGQSIEYEASVIFEASSSDSCSPHEHCDDWIVGTIIYNGGNNRAIFTQGYNLDDYLWHDARVWAKIQHQEKDGNGWDNEDPNHDLEIKLYGSWFDDTCEGAERDIDKFKRDDNDDMKVQQKRDDHNMRLRSDIQGFADFKVFHTSSTTPNPQVIGAPYWEN